MSVQMNTVDVSRIILRLKCIYVWCVCVCVCVCVCARARAHMYSMYDAHVCYLRGCLSEPTKPTIRPGAVQYW